MWQLYISCLMKMRPVGNIAFHFKVDQIEQVWGNMMLLNEMIILSATGDQNLVLRPADMISL